MCARLRVCFCCVPKPPFPAFCQYFLFAAFHPHSSCHQPSVSFFCTRLLRLACPTQACTHYPPPNVIQCPTCVLLFFCVIFFRFFLFFFWRCVACVDRCNAEQPHFHLHPSTPSPRLVSRVGCVRRLFFIYLFCIAFCLLWNGFLGVFFFFVALLCCAVFGRLEIFLFVVAFFSFSLTFFVSSQQQAHPVGKKAVAALPACFDLVRREKEQEIKKVRRGDMGGWGDGGGWWKGRGRGGA